MELGFGRRVTIDKLLSEIIGTAHQILEVHTAVKRFLRVGLPTASGMLLLSLSCGGSKESAADRHREANTPAGKVGKAAHAVAKESGKAAKVAGRELGKVAHQAKEGWKEAAADDKSKNKK